MSVKWNASIRHSIVMVVLFGKILFSCLYV